MMWVGVIMVHGICLNVLSGDPVYWRRRDGWCERQGPLKALQSAFPPWFNVHRIHSPLLVHYHCHHFCGTRCNDSNLLTQFRENQYRLCFRVVLSIPWGRQRRQHIPIGNASNRVNSFNNESKVVSIRPKYDRMSDNVRMHSFYNL